MRCMIFCLSARRTGSRSHSPTFGLFAAWWTVSWIPSRAGFQFEQNYGWYAAINSTYHLGVDGLSLPLVLLTSLLTPVSVLASFSIQERIKAFMILFLMLETGMLGVFMSL